jgi:hypothetical protein
LSHEKVLFRLPLGLDANAVELELGLGALLWVLRIEVSCFSPTSVLACWRRWWRQRCSSQPKERTVPANISRMSSPSISSSSFMLGSIVDLLIFNVSEFPFGFCECEFFFFVNFFFVEFFFFCEFFFFFFVCVCVIGGAEIFGWDSEI